MFNFQSFRLKFTPVLSVMLVTAVFLAQSETGSAILAAMQVVVNAQPQGF